jgi:hypothetical protein
MIGDLATWQRLTEPEMAELLAASAGGVAMGVAARAGLRKRFPADLVAAATDLGEARHRAIAKFGADIAERLLADRAGVEMASSRAVALHKARRFATRAGKGARVADLCCGIGGDAIALRAVGLDVLGVDADPVRAWMCGVNAGCEAVCARVEDEGAWSAPWFHLDPARRAEGGQRIFELGDLSPGPEVWRDVIGRTCAAAAGGPWGGAIKLGPGVDPEDVRAAIGDTAPLEMEYISENGRMSQAVAWAGELAGPGALRATMIAGESIETLTGSASDPPAGDLGAYVIEADDAIERSCLLGTLASAIAAHAVFPGLGLLTADRPAFGAGCTSFEVLAQMPWNEKRVGTWLREHDGGIVEIKTRGGAVNPDVLQHRLRGPGGTVHTIFVLKLGGRMQAIITRRLSPARSA